MTTSLERLAAGFGFLELQERLLGSRLAQLEYFSEIGAVEGGFVRFRYGKMGWKVLGFQELAPGGVIFVRIQVAREDGKGQVRTVFPWQVTRI